MTRTLAMFRKGWPFALLGGLSCSDARRELPDAAAADAGLADAAAQEAVPDAAAGDAGTPGEARIRQIEAGEPGIDHEGYGARPGDYLLENDQAAFVIAGSAPHDSFAPFGGFVVDAQLKDHEGPPYDGIGEIVPQVNGCGLRPIQFEMRREGRSARLRFTATEEAVPYALSYGDLPDPQGLQVTVEYVLAGEGRVLQLTTQVQNPGESAVPAAIGDYALFDSDEAMPITRPHGFWLGSTDTQLLSVGHAHETLPWVALLHAAGERLAMGGGRALKDLMKPDGGLWQYTLPVVQLAPGATHSATRYLALGHDIASAQLHQLRVTGVETGRVAGTVRAGENPAGGARVSFFSDDAAARFLGQALVDTEGRFAAELPAGPFRAVASARGRGEHVETKGRARLFAEGMGTGPVQRASAGSGTTAELALSLTPAAPVRLRVLDAAGRGLAAKISFVAEHDLPAADPAQGESEPYAAEHIPFVFWTLDGELDAALMPGRYTVVASRGPGYSLAVQSGVELRPGEPKTLSFTLATRLGAPGWVSIDSHVHAMDSQHGKAPRAERVVTAMAEGLDVMVNTDHDLIADYAPVVDRLGARAQLLPIAGVELTRLSMHHHNLWPLTASPSAWRSGGYRWWLDDRLDAALDYYAGLGALVIQINHGKQAFADAGFDPGTGSIREGADFSWRANAMEIQNGKRPTSRAGLLPTWYALLASGHRLAPLGGSDSHMRIPEPGGARTYVFLGAAERTPRAVAEAVAASRTVASTGPLVVLSALPGGQGVGDTLQLEPGQSVRLRLEVWGGEWLGLSRLRLVERGSAVAEWDATTTPALQSGEAGQWFAHELTVEPQADTWFALEVEGDAPLVPVYPGSLPWAHSAPLWIDVR